MMNIIILVCFYSIIPRVYSSDQISSRKPVFVDHPKDSYPLLRQQLRLYCRADGDPVPSITWFKDGKVVETQRDKPGTSNRITKHGELLFLSFGLEDEGNYYCNATNGFGWSKSESAIVKSAFFDSTRALGPESKTVNIGQTVLLECVLPIGLPQPVISWKHNNQEVVDNGRIKVLESGALRVDAARRTDGGNYQCVAFNVAGHWESPTVSVNVRRKPKFKFTPMSKQALAGESVEFQCLATEDPNSTIVWRRDGDKIIRASLVDRKTLRIERVQLSDAGDYICEAKNTAGRVEAIAHLTVVSPPIFVITPEDKSVFSGESVSFDCLTSGSPPPTVRWLHNKYSFWVPKPYSKPFVVDRFQVFPNGTLSINSTLPTDEGLYECRASQQAGIVKSSAQLSIRHNGMISIPLIELGPQNQTLYHGMIATLPCQATILQYTLQGADTLSRSNSFIPPLSVHWFINGTSISTIENPRLIVLNSGSLQINALRSSDSGVYTCEVKIQDFSGHNLVKRSASWTAHLTVIKGDPAIHDYILADKTTLLPDPPNDVTVVTVGDTWVLVELVGWEAQNSFVLRSSSLGVFHNSIQVEVTEFNSSNGWHIAHISHVSNSIRILRLQPRTGYHLLVRSINEHGVGKPLILNRLVFTSGSSLSLDYPRSELDIKLQSIDLSSILLRTISPSELLAEWSLCGSADTTTILTGFKAIYRNVPLSQCMKSVYYTRDAGGRPTITDQSSCAFKDELSDSGPDGFDDLPSCSLLRIHKQSLLDWNPPRFLSDEVVENFYHIDTTRTSKMVIGNLRPFMCYAVQIEAFADHPDFGRMFTQNSPVSFALTYDSTPTGAPQILNAHWFNNGTILKIEWSPPVEWERGGLLTGYSLRILGSISKQNHNILLGAEQLSYNVQHLDQWTNYTIYLSALTCHGEGVRSLPVYVFAQTYNTYNHFHEPDKFQSYPDGLRKILYDGRILSPDMTDLFDSEQRSQKLYDDDEEEEDENVRSKLSLTREPWFIVGAVLFSVVWVLICLGLIIYGRYRSERQRRRHAVLDAIDVGMITKNGPLTSASDSNVINSTGSPSLYMGGFTNCTGVDVSSLTMLDPISANAALLQDNTTVYNGGMNHLMNATPNNGLMNNNYNLNCNGNLHSITNYLPQYTINAQLATMDAMKNKGYSSSSGGMQSNTNHVLSTGNHHSAAEFLQINSQPMMSNGHVSATSVRSPQKPIVDDQATPYASVSVIQQMMFDRAPTEYSVITPPPTTLTKTTTAAVKCASRGRQLSLAEIIPPPPDYPPPSLPPCSPVAQHSTAWSLGEIVPCSGSGEDSAYSDFQESNQPQNADQNQHWPNPKPGPVNNLSTLAPAINEPVQQQQHQRSTVIVTTTAADWSKHETSLLLNTHSIEPQSEQLNHSSSSPQSVQASQIVSC